MLVRLALLDFHSCSSSHGFMLFWVPPSSLLSSQSVPLATISIPHIVIIVLFIPFYTCQCSPFIFTTRLIPHPLSPFSSAFERFHLAFLGLVFFSCANIAVRSLRFLSTSYTSSTLSYLSSCIAYCLPRFQLVRVIVTFASRSFYTVGFIVAERHLALGDAYGERSITSST